MTPCLLLEELVQRMFVSESTLTNSYSAFTLNGVIFRAG